MKIIVSLIFVISAASLPNLAHGEWRTVVQFPNTYTDFDFLQCALRLKQRLPAPQGVETSEYEYPVTLKHLSNPADEWSNILEFHIQPAHVLTKLNGGGDPPALTSEGRRVIRELFADGIFDLMIRADVPKGHPSKVELTIYDTMPGPGAFDAYAIALTPSLFRIEADCGGIKIPGDANHNACVDSVDSYIWYSNYLIRTVTRTNHFGVTFEEGDFDGNGRIDFSDLNILSSNWLRGCNIFQNIGPSI